MSDDSDWDFENSDDAKADIRAAVEYLLTQSVETAGPDGVREQGPILLFRL